MENNQDSSVDRPFLDEYKDMEKCEVPFFEKIEGTKQFKEKNYEEAIRHYSKALLAIKFLKDSPEMLEQAEKLTTEIIIPCNLNLSLCNIHTGNYTSAIKFADEVLKFDENNLKALYRRGISQMKKSNVNFYLLKSFIDNQFGEAKSNLYLAKQLDSKNKQIDLAVKQLKKHLEQQQAKEKLMSEKMLQGYKSSEKQKSYLSRMLEKIKMSVSSVLKFCKRRNNDKKQK